MSPAPHAPCRGQHCPVVAMLLAPRSNPLPIPEKTGWVGGRKNARAAAAALSQNALRAIDHAQPQAAATFDQLWRGVTTPRPQHGQG